MAPRKLQVGQESGRLPRSPAIELRNARAAWLEGHYAEASALLAGIAPRSSDDKIEAALLRARCALRIGRPVEAREALNGLEPGLHLDADDADAIQTLRGIAIFRSGDEPAGMVLLDGPLGGRDPYVVAERAYYRAFALWTQRRLDEAEGALAPALDAGLDVMSARALGLLGWIETSRRRYAFAARAFAQALAAGQSNTHRDEHLLASLLHGLSSLASEMLDLPAARSIEQTYGAINWTADLARPRTYVLQNRALLWLLKGDPIEAWSLLQEALTIAPSDAHRLLVHTELTSLHRIVGDTFAARRHLDAARELLKATKWADQNADERVSLLAFAVEAARQRDPFASDAMVRYHSARRTKNAIAALYVDPRVEALEAHAAGLVAAMRGQVESAVRTLRGAVERWSVLGYRLRFIQALIDVASYDQRADELTRAEAACSVIPLSWLRSEVTALRGQIGETPDALSPAERRVMAAICEGKSAREIADEFGRSPHTINNQTRRVFQVMGVRSRGALIVECVRRGILDSNVAERSANPRSPGIADGRRLRNSGT